ncbi:hypothetical protein SUGI_1202880 [Cryptomeria japonica]|nr:hypothetical protein SUGI_1202880 [Cryptomeria japonica]
MSAPHAILAQQILNSPAASVSPSLANVHHKVGASHVVAPTASVAVVAFALVAATFSMEDSGISHYLRKYGLKKFLFLDQLCDDTAQVQLGYTT